MDGIAIYLIATAGLNVFILGAVLVNTRRIGNIEGGLKNGGYTRCPFFKGHINKEVKVGQQGGKVS